MTEISSVSSATTTQSTSTKSTKGLAGDFDAFLTMLTVQMKNQDPLNPAESADYAVQLATFAGVEQQTQTNTLLEKIAGNVGGGSLADYASWIGKEVAAPTNVSFDGAPLTLLPDFPTDSERAVIEVRAGGGTVIERFDLPLNPGAVTWNGRSPDGHSYLSGNYRFETVGYSGDKEVSREATPVYQQVTELRSGPKGTQLVLASGELVSPEVVGALKGS